MANDEAECPNCGHPVKAGETLCGYCGLNLVSGESYEDKIKRAQGRQRTSERSGRIGGVGLAVTLGLLILAGFMYQRRVMKVFRAQTSQCEDYIERAAQVRYLTHLYLEKQSGGAGERYNEQARTIGEKLLEDLENEVGTEDSGSGGRSDKSESLDETKETFVKNIQCKVEYHLGRLPGN